MQDSNLSIGDQVEARCTKCRKNNEHTILLIEEGVPFKVECSVCNRQHKYRTPIPPKKVAVKRVVDPNHAAKKEWAILRPEMNMTKVTDYSMTAAYKVNALLNHTDFGIGLVQRIAGDQKVEVLFEDGRKIMRCR
ncbi:MAG: hypothetical protein IBX47_12205 [Desulfuromonadales bacterium]|nr:hypothetical protein [Desulfuromonadales bacterium]